MVLWNNNTKAPIRCIVAYDWLLMRDYFDNWKPGMGKRFLVDLQANIPLKLFNKREEPSKIKYRGLYVGLIYKRYDVDYSFIFNFVEQSKKFTSAIFNFKFGFTW